MSFQLKYSGEIRSIFSHFSRAYDDSLEEEEIASELSKAEGHLKRAILDCYKYACLSLVDSYERFRKEYKFADLAGIDNGDFLLMLTQSFSTGKQLLYKAKLS